jgi:hypothetical protein
MTEGGIMDTAATQHDVTLDVLSILDDAPAGRLVGSENTTIALVGEGERDSIVLELNNGQRFRLTVRSES